MQEADKNEEQLKTFETHLYRETELLEQWFNQGNFSNEELEIGSELEFFLIDEHYNPLPKNLEFIKTVNQPFLKPEVGAAHLEINTKHFKLTGDCLSKLHNNILDCWTICQSKLIKNKSHLVMIGTLPSASLKCHQERYLTQKKRYFSINKEMQGFNQKEGILVNLNGFEKLNIHPNSLAINGLLSAFQLHLQVDFARSVNFYNIAQAISGPILSLCCNSPFLFSHAIEHESRIFVFDEVMTLRNFNHKKNFKCCLFGKEYIKHSFFELFKENLYYPCLVPKSMPQAKENMFHVRKQNGVVYRWNRPVLDFNANHEPHLRIEFRAPSSGPTVIDMIATAALYYGLMAYFVSCEEPIEKQLLFKYARRNFFKAARYGFHCELTWLNERNISVRKLLKELLPLAHKGLKFLDISQADINLYLGIITERVRVGMNGSDWQIRFIEKYGNDFEGLLEKYLENQLKELPISTWKM